MRKHIRARGLLVGLASAAVVVAVGAATMPAAADSTPTQSTAVTAPTDTWLPGPADYPSYNGLALTPPMGFNDWAHYYCNINEKLFTDTADAMVSDGLSELGYKYVNIDDCWMLHDRDAAGNLQVNSSLFPHGMKWLGDYLHAKGLKFGTYEDAGYKTCQGAAGMYGHFDQDAKLLASWGVDYLKLDYCYQPTDRFPGKTAAEVAHIVYHEASQALLNSGRPMVFSESAPAYYCCSSQNFKDVMSWIGQEGNLWRFGSDISDSWDSVMRNYEQGNTPGLAAYAGPGHWNDADMLEVGNPGLSLTEQRSQFSLWSEMASPLLISTDLPNISAPELAILKNADVIAIDQDPYGAQGTIVKQQGNVDILSKPLANGDIAVTLFNNGDSTANASITAQDAGFSTTNAAYLLKDLWSKKVTETADVISATVPAHGVTMYRVSPGTPQQAPPSVAVSLSGSAFKAGTPTSVTATVVDHGQLPLNDVDVQLATPDGWSVRATTPTKLPELAPGSSAQVSWSVTPESLVPGHSYSLDATATYSWPDGAPTSSSGAESFIAPYVAQYASLADAFNNVGITDDNDTTPAGLNGGFDGDGDTYSAQELARIDLGPGASITYDGTTFSWPAVPAGQPDNVAGGGRSIAFTGSGSSLGFLGADAYSRPGMTVEITYADGTVQQFPLQFPNWSSGGTSVVTMNHRNTPSGPANFGVPYSIYYRSVPLLPGKQVAVVTLPDSSSVHVFAMAIKG